MFDLFQQLSGWLTVIFVVLSMLNVGLTQDPRKLLQHLRDWQYLVRMLVANFLVVPGVMLLAVVMFEIPAPYSSALLIFSAAAGAPLLIKLTAQSDNDIGQGATIQMVHMAATVLLLPTLLPMLLDDTVSVGMWAIAQPLLLQMITPLIAGMILRTVAEKVAGAIQTPVARISNIALYGLLIFAVLGYLPQLIDAQLWGALLTGMAVLLIAFYVGYGTGQGRPAQSQLGALGTAQRNTAAALITSSQFDDPRVFLTVIMLNTLMMFLLLWLATRLGNDAKIAFLEPLEADMPGGVERPYSDDPAGGARLARKLRLRKPTS
ncbi:sodium:proton symporter [Corynebacterium yudongzhengii]|uniref:Sodium:proton symporter n=1 Tax=Corynebacterium yudongzhengii TaxID=2080740 RepID=A0A2U1T4J8_9CORY|nr:bile acid:sodium symporter [Corynebacterium yudongzhengii]AWB80974.1 sodium:proton symporter [Corynebacterium yudongzhengii]PWC00913.1 sodium:proton symporter [Corynebacterium yudongzhengii]